MNTETSAPTSCHWPDLLTALSRGEDLTRQQAYWAMDTIMEGEVPDAVIAGFLMALRTKGESVSELNGLADAMVAHARRISIPGPALDIVGTGGDRLSSVNISTMAALVCAGAGARVVKHGNRASSSKSGSADVLEVLGVQLDMPVERVQRAAGEVGITFLFAQTFHPAMRHVAPARKALGVPTAFNFLGPITNPARVSASAIGVADAALAPLMAGVFQQRGDRALVFRGGDGLDELTVTAPSAVWEVRDGQTAQHELDPLDLGMPRATIADLRGKDAAYNADVVRDVLDGAAGHIRNAVLLNAAAGLVAVSEDAEGPFAERFAAAVDRAAVSIDSGAARDVLSRWVEFAAA
ncbi:anthranilate phosphoribosyltransferase [Kocuria rhizophila]|uniref:Anthranilate phosphoribosyltransferase n=1 Tax=Kocuria rhizophila (strain ATCC 9341 / DSM 348 / NBRC 103217 / DC2201) TaxID=378753 RepID=B2GHS3_KOCRD|nr:anthranilate phosphoribosyltransferase [Kocuria rhizophila]ASE10491.1 anthranilate phosphoribosyltransferase [Kocuria rhizophila]MCC5674352.1 anthranilate phosphoribosyltransferase [Kocuria rhizophila]MDV5999174.1 anthranilate phosphoribosyltransferase [Kocuria rhizophila]VEH75096.1 Anthranilate phosphoribosyltransferase [Kocuria rhizophila]BAG29626.1 anthranilate phosphoribosyltransferase [Kocuria rhizophila DC2201]